jgi:YHS domain-containing protein
MYRAFIIIAFSLLVGHAFSQTDDLRRKHFNVKKNLALEGYDPVSYFDGKPEEGNEEIQAVNKGLMYLFLNEKNLEKFNASPEKYEPAYGGWCAYAMGETGEKVKVDPETFKILDGKLYLFYNFWGNNTLEEWNKMEKKLKESANLNWKRTLH